MQTHWDGHRTSNTQKTVSYTYRKAGERTSITYPDEKTIYYVFDQQVRLTELRVLRFCFTYGYDAAGRLAEKHFPGRLHTDYRYYSKGQRVSDKIWIHRTGRCELHPVYRRTGNEVFLQSASPFTGNGGLDQNHPDCHRTAGAATERQYLVGRTVSNSGYGFSREKTNIICI